MEGSPKRTVPKIETAQTRAEPTPPEEASDAHPAVEETTQLREEKSGSDNIHIRKEMLLAAGGVSIEPLEGDPFVLSREHKSTGEGVTIYTSDGAVKKMTIEGYQARLREHARAARMFSQQSREQRDTALPPQAPQTTRKTGWLKRAFTALWSKLWK